MGIQLAIDTAFKKAVERKWDCTYWFVDIHDTVLEADYRKGVSKTFVPMAEKVLQQLSDRPDIVLILWTCSWPEEIKGYLEFFREHGIEFQHANENPNVKSVEGRYGCFDQKPYADVVLDDKSGFDWQDDWDSVREALRANPVLPGAVVRYCQHGRKAGYLCPHCFKQV